MKDPVFWPIYILIVIHQENRPFPIKIYKPEYLKYLSQEFMALSKIPFTNGYTLKSSLYADNTSVAQPNIEYHNDKI